MSRRDVLLEALGATPRDLRRMLRQVDDQAAGRRPVPDAWCIRQVLSHLSAVEELYLQRLQRVVTLDNPYEAAIEPAAGADRVECPLPRLVDEFVARRGATIAYLSDLQQRDWARRLVHQTVGPTRLRDQVQALVAHDNEHLSQIADLRELEETKG